MPSDPYRRRAESEPALWIRDRQRSRLASMSTLLPPLIPEHADTPPPQGIHRKPLPAVLPRSSNDPNQPPQYLRDSRHAGETYNVGLGIAGPVPPPDVYRPDLTAYNPYPVEQHDSQPPAGYEHQSGRHAMLKKTQKIPYVPQAQQPPPLPPNRAAPGLVTQPKPQLHETQATPSTQHIRERRRSNSVHQLSPTSKPPHGNRLQPRGVSPAPEPRVRSSSAQPPPKRGAASDSSQVVSTPNGSRPNSLHSSDGAQSPKVASERGRLRRSWLPGGRSRSNSKDMPGGRNSVAWILSADSHTDYNTTFLTSGDKVPELWNENGTVCVHLFSKGSGYGPSFKVPAYIIVSSGVFNDLIQSEMSPTSARSRARSFGGRNSLSVEDAARQSPSNSPPPGTESPDEVRLYIPWGSVSNGQRVASNQQSVPELERLIAVRNLFAFLTGQPLVGTKAHRTVFAVLMQISSLLREFDFGTYDGSSFGEAVDLSFGFFLSQTNLPDVRQSREKTVEALVLGERMKSWDLYNEAFCHAVGKYTAILDVKSPLFDRLTMSTRRRLERAHLDLLNRQNNVNMRLEQFEVPSLFAGIANSTSHDEYRNVRFKNWKASFGKMRSFVLGYYKALFGHWPPKASSKKNPFSESGLNRQVLKALYSDLCSLYDLIVDRESITTRVIDESPEDIHEESVDPNISALRKILSEFDHSSPPVLPPIPFDVPKIPTMTSILETYDNLPAKEQARFDRRIQPNELMLILLKSRNMDTDGLKLPFLNAFKEFELKEAKGSTALDLADQRIGHWLFLYVVIQSLPMLVVDAPGLRHTEGVEYFLCEPPQGNLPWVEDAGEIRKVWYEVSGGQGIVELSADVVMFSVEATYHRSHCWLAAKQWEASNGGSAPPPPPTMSPLEPPRNVFQNIEPVLTAPHHGTGGGPPSGPGSPSLLPLRPRNASPGPGRAVYRSSVAFGLEPLPFPDGGGHPGDRSSRVVSSSRVSPAGSRPNSIPPGRIMPRSASAGNLNKMARDAGNESPHGGSTFDDILKGMGKDQNKPKKSKFPF